MLYIRQALVTLYTLTKTGRLLIAIMWRRTDRWCTHSLCSTQVGSVNECTVTGNRPSTPPHPTPRRRHWD